MPQHDIVIVIRKTTLPSPTTTKKKDLVTSFKSDLIATAAIPLPFKAGGKKKLHRRDFCVTVHHSAAIFEPLFTGVYVRSTIVHTSHPSLSEKEAGRIPSSHCH